MKTIYIGRFIMLVVYVGIRNIVVYTRETEDGEWSYATEKWFNLSPNRLSKRNRRSIHRFLDRNGATGDLAALEKIYELFSI